MYIDLTKISDGQTQFDEKLQIDLEDESVQLIETVRIWGELRKGIVQVDIAGKISGAVEVESLRCCIDMTHEKGRHYNQPPRKPALSKPLRMYGHRRRRRQKNCVR